jgi:predicted  nucleic acid-binding Zn-ribbon protein
MNTDSKILEVEQPITDRTQAIKDMDAKLQTQLQDVTQAVHEIRELLKRQESKSEKIIAAFKRAIHQFFSQI